MSSTVVSLIRRPTLRLNPNDDVVIAARPLPARTRIEASLQPPSDGSFDVFNPDNVAPLICWLSLADCPATGQVFQAYGDRVAVIAPSSIALDARTQGRWTLDALDAALKDRLPRLPALGDFVEGLPL